MQGTLASLDLDQGDRGTGARVVGSSERERLVLLFAGCDQLMVVGSCEMQRQVLFGARGDQGSGLRIPAPPSLPQEMTRIPARVLL